MTSSFYLFIEKCLIGMDNHILLIMDDEDVLS